MMPLRKASVDQFSLMMMNKMVITYVAFSGSSLVALQKEKNIIQLSSEGEVNSGGYIPRREASRYISTALHRP